MTKAAFAWYTSETYSRLREISTDKHRLPLTFEEWQDRAQTQFDGLKQGGLDLCKVMVDPNALLAWANGAPVDAQTRSKFAAFLFMQQHEKSGLH
jgi:hypothetical protein